MEIDISGGGWRRWASAFDSGDGRRWALAFNGGDGRQLRWMIEKEFYSGDSGVRWQQQHSTAFNGIGNGDGLRREDEKVAQGQATQQPHCSQHDERTRGRCNEGTTRDDGMTTSWHDETTRGGTMRRQDSERAAHREATQQPAGATRGQEGCAGHNERTRRGDASASWCNKLTRWWRNERTTRGNATTSWRDKTTRGQCNGCNNQLARQDNPPTALNPNYRGSRTQP